MFNFRVGSGWSLELELECFIIFKELEEAEFSRGLQSLLCEELSRRCQLDSGTLKAKVGNFKSERGYTNDSNSSRATKYIVKHFGDYDLKEARALLAGYKLGSLALKEPQK